MKNIHVLRTENPSRIIIFNDNKLDVLPDSDYRKEDLKIANFIPQHIYITSDEEIKPSDYYLWKENEVIKANDIEISFHPTVIIDCKKIILTTDQDLIKDGVQAIDDEFLEWFVKNPTCEEVEVVDIRDEGIFATLFPYKIIIPKEEPKTAWVGVLHDKLHEYHPAEYEIKYNSVKIQNDNKMGMYTELIFGASLKTDTPKEVIDTLRYMVGDIEQPEKLAFNSNRNPLKGGSHYFGVISGATKMYYNDTAECWVLSSRANIKIYDSDIETFLEWIKTFVDSGSGNKDMYAITIYEEQSEPTVYYLYDVD